MPISCRIQLVTIYRVDKQPWAQMLRRYTTKLGWDMSIDQLVEGIRDTTTLSQVYQADDATSSDGWVGLKALSRLSGESRRLKLFAEAVGSDSKRHTISASFAIGAPNDGYKLIVDDILTTGDFAKDDLGIYANQKFR